MKISAIDLFCGIGGLSYGLKKAGIPVKLGIDLDGTCRYAYEQNVEGEFRDVSVSDVKGKELVSRYWNDEGEIKVLVGCAPCQPFSTHSNKHKEKESNAKWHLLNEFKRLILETSPDIVSMENVPNLSNQTIFKEFKDFLEHNHYSVSSKNVYCPDYGIPQKRRRLVLLASIFGEIEIIKPTHTPENYVTTKDAIGALKPVEAGKVCSTDPMHRTTNLSEVNLQRIKASKPNGTWLDWSDDLRLECHKKESGHTYKSVYGRMSWDEPSPTITTQFYNYGTGRFGHPVQNRALTLREGAILQSFPKSYKFYDNAKALKINQVAIHIGNAVPVKLGNVIGKSILKHLKNHDH